jgi:hypothetical protein
VSIYSRMRPRAGALLGRFRQGDVSLVRPPSYTGPAHQPVEASPALVTPVDAVVTGVLQKYVDGTRILASDLLVTCAVVTGLAPAMDWRVSIGGVQHQIVTTMHAPAGDPVVWRFVVRR